MNYGETLAYWYLRLNGFFPLRNFVMHDDREDRSECDVLAVRHPDVYEEIGGKANDWDNPTFEELGLALDRTIALVVQVKTGGQRTPGRAFDPERLKRGLRRTGLWSRESVDELAGQLDATAKVDVGEHHVIGKLLIASNPAPDDRYLGLELRKVVTFIRKRFKDYPEKEKDRLFFGDELIQFLADRSLEVQPEAPPR